MKMAGDRKSLPVISSKGFFSYALLVRERTGSSADSTALRQETARQLSAYMVPAAVILVKKFPLTSNGKLDVNALPLLFAHPETTHHAQEFNPCAWLN